jgi:hypothetical protein
MPLLCCRHVGQDNCVITIKLIIEMTIKGSMKATVVQLLFCFSFDLLLNLVQSTENTRHWDNVGLRR